MYKIKDAKDIAPKLYKVFYEAVWKGTIQIHSVKIIALVSKTTDMKKKIRKIQTNLSVKNK